MTGGRSSAVRAVGVFAAGMVAAGILATGPAGAHIGTKIGHVIGHVIKKLDPRYDARYVQQSNFARFGQIKMNVGDPDQTIGAWGPFTLLARCELTDTEDVRGRVIINTSEANSAFESDEDNEEDFDPSDNPNPPIWADETGFPVGGAPSTSGEDDEAHAQAPSGTSIFGQTTTYTNFAGAHCVFSGFVIRTAG